MISPATAIIHWLVFAIDMKMYILLKYSSRVGEFEWVSDIFVIIFINTIVCCGSDCVIRVGFIPGRCSRGCRKPWLMKSQE